MKGAWSVFRLLLAAKTHSCVPSTGLRWQWQQVFPTKPSPVQSHCVASHLSLLLSSALRSQRAGNMASLVPGESPEETGLPLQCFLPVDAAVCPVRSPRGCPPAPK